MPFLGTQLGERLLGSLLAHWLFCLLIGFAFSGIFSPAGKVTMFYLLKKTERLGNMFITYHSFIFSVDDNYL